VYLQNYTADSNQTGIRMTHDWGDATSVKFANK